MITMEFDRRQSFQQMVEIIGYALSLPASIWLLDESGEALRVAAAVGVPDDYVRDSVLRLDETSAAVEAFETGQTVVVDEIAIDARWKYKAEADAMGFKSAIVVPLRVKKRVAGVLDVYTKRVRKFTNLEQTLVENFATQVAITHRRIRDLETLNEVSLLVSSELGAADLFERIVRAAQKVLDCQHVTIFVKDKSGDLVRMATSSDGIVHKSFAIGEGIAGWVAKTKRSERVPDAVKHPHFIPGSSSLLERSMLVVPVLLGDEALGVISADMDGLDGFDEHDQVLLEAVAGQAAVALHNARLFRNVDRNWSALVEFGQAVAAASHSSEQEILHRIYEQTSRLMDTANMSIALYDEATDTVRFGLAMRDGRPIDVEEEPGWGPRPGRGGKGKTNDIIRNRNPILLSTKQEEEAWYAQEEGRERRVEPRASYLGVPMMLGEKVVGVIDIYSLTEEYLYDKDDLEIMQAIANHAAIALDNAHMFYDVDQRRRALVDFGQSIASDIRLNEEKILQSIYARASQLMDSDTISIILYDEEADTICFGLAMQDGIPIDTETEENWRPRSGSVRKGKTNQVIRTKKPLLFSTREELKQWYDRPDTIQYIDDQRASWLGVPMILGDKVLGVIDCSHMTREYAYSQDDVDVLQAIASYAAVALDNAHLFRQTQQQLEQLGILNRVSELLMEEREVGETVRLLMKETLQLFNADHGSFWFVDYVHQRLHLEFSIGRSGETSAWQDEVQKITIPLRADSSIAGNTAVTQEPNLWNEISECPYWNGEFDKQTGYKSKRMLVVPLLLRFEVFEETEPIASLAEAQRTARDRAIGVLQLLNTVDGSDFTEDDQRFLMSIARMAAIALHDAETHEREVALSEIGRALTAGSRLDESEILELIHQQTGKLMDADNMYIALYDEATDIVWFGLAFVDGNQVDVEKEEAWQPRKAGKGRTEEIIRAKKPIFTATEAEAEAWYAQPGREGYTKGPIWPSWVGVPMMVGEEVLGVIAAYHPALEYVYSADDLEILQGIADQAAVALDNAYMFYDVNRRLDTLVEFGREVRDVRLTESEILELIYSQASELMDTDNMYIALYDEFADTVRFGLAFVGGRRVDVEKQVGWQPRKAGKGRTEEIIHTKKPIFNPTKAESEAWYALPEHKEYIGEPMASWLGVPMMVGEKVLGVIATYHQTRNYVYSGDDQKILQALADQAAVALGNAAWYRRIESLRRIMSAITAKSTLQSLLDSILDETTELLGADFATIQLVDKATNELVVRAHKGLGDAALPPELYRIDMGVGVTGKVAQNKWTIRSGNVSVLDYYQDLFKQSTKSELAIPLLDGDEVVGVLNVEAVRENAFDEDDEELFKLLAEQVVVAIRIAWLFGSLRTEQEKRVAAGRLETVNTVAAEFVHKLNNVAGTIPARVEMIKELLDPNDPGYPKIEHFLGAISNDIDGILRTAQAIKAPAPEELESVNISTVVSTAITRIALPPDIKIDNKCEEGLPPILAYGGQLVDAIENIVRNGIDAINGKGVITIRGRKIEKAAERFVVVEVEDTGCGISPDGLPRIFDLFYSTKGGMGFALWKTKTLVESLGGRIDVASKVGEGTVFEIVLPVLAEEV